MPFTAQDCRAKALERHRGMAQRWRSLSERLEWVTAQQAARMSGVSWLARTGEPAPGFRPPVNSSSMRTAGDRGAKVGRDGDMRARLKKRDHEEYVLRRAKELADSGRFSGWLGIEFELRYGEGFELARVWLDYAPLREELDLMCQQAQARRSLGVV